MALLTAAERHEFGSTHTGWIVGDDSIARSFVFPDFVEAVGFVTRVALLAEKAFHHPDIEIRWNTVTLRLSTHSEGGLTAKDTDLAARIDSLA
jgi:4a-hydroxytetrahydrobiopterin dehydratase